MKLFMEKSFYKIIFPNIIISFSILNIKLMFNKISLDLIIIN